jgi:hypothetical protein
MKFGKCITLPIEEYQRLKYPADKRVLKAEEDASYYRVEATLAMDRARKAEARNEKLEEKFVGLGNTMRLCAEELYKLYDIPGFSSPRLRSVIHRVENCISSSRAYY